MPRPARLRNASLIAAALFCALALAAYRIDYFPIDLAVTRAFQRFQGPAITTLMMAESWPGYQPRVVILTGLVAGALAFLRMRREGLFVLFAGLGPVLGEGLKLIVQRPRPSPDLVRVVHHLDSWSYPSGHVAWATAVGGFLGVLAATRMRPGSMRRVLVGAVLAFVILMGTSRIWLGEHWLSDTVGGYLFGAAWLGFTVRLYQGRERPAVL